MPVTVTQLQATIGADDTEIVKAVQRIEASFEKMGASIVAAFEKASEKAKEDLNKIEQSAENTGKKGGNALTAGFKKAWDFIGDGSIRAGKSLSLYVTAPLLLIGKHALEVAGDFEQSMSILQVAAGASGEQINKLKSLATDLGADLSIPGTSATTAAAAMTELTKSGLKVNDTMAAAKPTLLLAAAGMMDNADAAQKLGMILNQFQLDGTQAYRVANLLAGAGKNVTGGVKGMSDALLHAGTAFRTLQVPVKDAVTTLALMARNGFVGETAGTQLKTALLRLAEASKDAKTPAHELAQELFDLSTGQMKPMSEVVQILHDKLGSLSPRQQAVIGGALGGVRAFQALAVIARYTGQQFKELGDHVNQTGVLEAEAKAKTDNVKGAMAQLQSSIDTALNSALMPFMDSLKKIIAGAADAIVQFSKWSDGAKKLTVGLVAVVALAGPTLIFLGSLKNAITALIPVFTAARTAALWLWGAIGGPATIAIGIVIGLVILLYNAWTKNWGHIQEFTKAVWDQIVDEFQTDVHNIELIWSGLIDFLHARWKQGMEKLDTAVHNTARGFGAHFKDEMDASAKAAEDAANKAALAQIKALGDINSAAANKVNDNLHPGKNDPNLDLSGKKKTDEHAKQLDKLNDALADSSARLAEAQVKLHLAQKGASDQMQEAASRAIELRHEYDLLEGRTVQPLINRENAASAVENQVSGLNKYRDKLRETQTAIHQLTNSEKFEKDSIQDLAREYPGATKAQIDFLASQIQWQKHLDAAHSSTVKAVEAVRGLRVQLLGLNTNAPDAKAAVELFGAEMMKTNPAIKTATDLWVALSPKQRQAASDFAELGRRIKEAELAQQIKQIALQYHEWDAIVKGGPASASNILFSDAQRYAMELYKKGWGDLTDAEKKNGLQMYDNSKIAERNQIYFKSLTERQDDLKNAYVRARVEQDKTNDALKVQALHLRVATFALQKFGVVWTELNAQTQDVIKDLFQVDERMKALDELQQSVQSVFEHAFENIRGGLKGLFSDIMTGVEDLLTQIAAKFVAAQLTNLLFSLFPGGTNFLSSLMSGGTPGRALGGSVQPGQSYIVGENGPEMFVPSGGGRVIPNNETRAVLAGNSPTFNINITTPDAQSFMQSRSQIQSTILQMADAHRRRNGG